MNKLLLLAVAAIGCSTVQAKTDFDRSANFGGFRTFKMLEGKALPSESGAPRTRWSLTASARRSGTSCWQRA